MKIIPLKVDCLVRKADGERFYATAEYDQEFHVWSAGIAFTVNGAESTESATRMLAQKAREFAEAVDEDGREVTK